MAGEPWPEQKARYEYIEFALRLPASALVQTPIDPAVKERAAEVLQELRIAVSEEEPPDRAKRNNPSCANLWVSWDSGTFSLRMLLIHPALSRTLKPKEPTMTIEIRDASLEARIRKQLQATGSSSVEEVLLRLLDAQEEQDRWLLENRQEVNAKIRRGIAQLDRGEGIPEDQLDAYLAKLKAQPE